MHSDEFTTHLYFVSKLWLTENHYQQLMSCYTTDDETCIAISILIWMKIRFRPQFGRLIFLIIRQLCNNNNMNIFNQGKPVNQSCYQGVP